MGWLQRLQDGLTKTRKSVQGSLRRLISSGPDQAVLEEVEEALLSADVGVRVVDRLLEQIRTEGVSTDSSDPLQPFKDTLVKIFDAIPSASLEDLVRHGPRPYVLLAIGINGVGKTTTVAKLGKKFQQANLQPLFVAADTFRAAATEQLLTWGNRIGIEVIRHQQGADPAAVVYDGMAAAKSRKSDVVLIDTAGRLHTKVNLMQELEKMKRVIARELPGAPHEVLLTLDGTLGQNTITQAKQFHEALGVTGIALTKLDGTAKGGVVVALAEELQIPIRLIGVGEGEDDLQDFRAHEFVDALLHMDEISKP
ncbi:MAG: signal recognition particle-docking protein FtsY [Nitrospirales bacterium]|nr:signal recognition particle-docking protein FtsY [Nitrospira sp.]MDR4501599.1 signal recognition particle-docking protein FtsY [Nitrospirales bacterium]